jgi:hypothetical protein
MKKESDMQQSAYFVKKLKEWEGQDGYGCHGDIHHRAKGLVARFRDEGGGGGMYPEVAYAKGEYLHEEFEEFKKWANAHPVLPIVWKNWGFEPTSKDHTDEVVEILIIEHHIDKRVKKGYLVYQKPSEPSTFFGAKSGRKHTRYSEETAKWLRGKEPTAIIRNETSPEWVIGDEVK